MLKKFNNCCVTVLLVISVCGCSFFAPYTQNIHISGVPAGATVSVNGTEVKAPATVEVQRNKNLTIAVYKEGFEPYKVTTGYTLSTVGAVDAVGCWLLLLPGLGLLSPGAWELLENNFFYVLTPAGKSSTQKSVVK